MKGKEILRYSPLLGFLLLVAYLYGICYLPLRGEEANRILTAYEMVKNGDFFNLTHLGEPYYLKPPLFEWVLAGINTLLGWSVEISRLVSVLSSFASALLVYLFSKQLYGDKTVAFISAPVFLTLGDLIMFYGFVAEIDAFHNLVYFAGSLLTFWLLRRAKIGLAFFTAGVFTALLFLTKGFPALYHLPLTFLVFLFYFNLRGSLSFTALLGGTGGFLLPLLGWIINLKNPQVYLLHLWGESFNRTPLAEGGKLITLLKHIFAYPLLNFKQLLPHSLFFLLSKAWKRIKRERATVLLLTLIGLNYLPYLISPGARGRYILVIFPFIAVLLAPLLGDFLLKRIKGLKPAIAGIFLILLINLFLVYKNFAFFENYGFLPLWGMFVALTLGGFLILRYFPTLLGLTVVFLALFKFSYINHYAPWKEKRHPEREVALRFSQKLPKGAKIRYLPQWVNMELCAYLDLYTEGLVTRKEGKYFVSRKPPEGDYKILDSYKGWILGEF
jgi:4-amino-4-deoxy-L-arabinose transferase-like glycosyltransferase